MARRLIPVVLTDFIAWFPVALLGILSATGLFDCSKLAMLLVVVFLPANAALNPFLYTVSMVKDLKRSRLKEKIREDVQAEVCNNNTSRAVTVITPV